MIRHLYTQPELFADDDRAVEVEVYERPDGTTYRVERATMSARRTPIDR